MSVRGRSARADSPRPTAGCTGVLSCRLEREDNCRQNEERAKPSPFLRGGSPGTLRRLRGAALGRSVRFSGQGRKHWRYPLHYTARRFKPKMPSPHGRFIARPRRRVTRAARHGWERERHRRRAAFLMSQAVEQSPFREIGLDPSTASPARCRPSRCAGRVGERPYEGVPAEAKLHKQARQERVVEPRRVDLVGW